MTLMFPRITDSIWTIRLPESWPKPPKTMSISKLRSIESCPLRWSLSAGDYPHIWNRPGYPDVPQLSSVEGNVVHDVLQSITVALLRAQVPSLSHNSAISVIRDLGGFSAILRSGIENSLSPLRDNPRALHIIGTLRERLDALIPELRCSVQDFLSRMHYIAPKYMIDTADVDKQPSSRSPLAYGSYAEVALHATAMNWTGIADLITLKDNYCEIRDYKTGSPKAEHEEQLQVYALLWAKDEELNPSASLANALVLSYLDKDIRIDTPSSAQLGVLERTLKERSIAAIESIKQSPPHANPSEENCRFCSVRQLCSKYWVWLSEVPSRKMLPAPEFADVQMKITGNHGPMSWDGAVECSIAPIVNIPALLRTSTANMGLSIGQRVRLLNVSVVPHSDDNHQESNNRLVITLRSNSELFIVGNSLGQVQ